MTHPEKVICSAAPYGEAFTVLPFGNFLVTKTFTGAQIEQLLEQQFTGCPNNQPFNRIL